MPTIPRPTAGDYLDAFADAGETQAMLLYKEVDADYLLIGRPCA